MKKSYPFPRSTLAVAGLLVLLSASAQGPHFGVKVGANLSNLHDNEVTDDNARFGFHIGVMGRTAADQAIGLQAELLYTTLGNRTDYSAFFGLVDQSVDFNLNYIQLPVMVSFRLAEGAFEIQAGGYAAYLVNAKVTTDGDLGDGEDDLETDNFNSMDFGLVGGLAFNGGPVQVGVRYNYGLTRISDSDAADSILGDAKNSCAQLYIAVGMP
jgi:hypothetical protein